MCDDWAIFEHSTIEKLPNISGVYFLMSGCELVYIGQSNNIRKRIQLHNSNWNCTLFLGNRPIGVDSFDNIFYFRCDYKPERKAYEYMFRDDYWPKLNGYDIEREHLIPKYNIDREEMKEFVEGW